MNTDTSMRLSRSSGTSVRVIVRCVETGQIWPSKQKWLADMKDAGFSYHKCRRALMHSRELGGLNYEIITNNLA